MFVACSTFWMNGTMAMEQSNHRQISVRTHKFLQAKGCLFFERSHLFMCIWNSVIFTDLCFQYLFSAVIRILVQISSSGLIICVFCLNIYNYIAWRMNFLARFTDAQHINVSSMNSLLFVFSNYLFFEHCVCSDERIDAAIMMLSSHSEKGSAD